MRFFFPEHPLSDLLYRSHLTIPEAHPHSCHFPGLTVSVVHNRAEAALLHLSDLQKSFGWFQMPEENDAAFCPHPSPPESVSGGYMPPVFRYYTHIPARLPSYASSFEAPKSAVLHGYLPDRTFQSVPL